MRLTLSPRAAGWPCLLALLALACATPVGVEKVDERTVQRRLTSSVLTTGEPGPWSRQALSRSDLLGVWEKNPDGALAGLRQRWVDEGRPGDLFALAELSYHRAENGGGQAHWLAASVYAYAFLFPGAAGHPPDPFDPRLRVAADLYNRGLTDGLADRPGGSLDLSTRVLPLPFGEFELASDPGSFLWVNHRLEDFFPVADIEVAGLRNRFRRAGIGAPVAARIGPIADGLPESPDERWLPKKLRVPATVFVRIQQPVEALRQGRVSAQLELFIGHGHDSVSIDGRDVPLEYEPTAALALGLSEARIWDLELALFRGQKVDVAATTDLVMLSPHQRGRIPVVLVHGTVSSPARWVELFNELSLDSQLRGRYEVWLFFYPSGNPILYSAAALRESLKDAVARLDPDGTDPGLQRMVVIGHSQGGLLTKLMVVEGGDALWSQMSEVPFDELELRPESRQLIERLLFFEPVPQVRRVIFMATPHGGSFLAGYRLGAMTSRLVKLPVNIAQAGTDLLVNDEAELVQRRIERVPSSIDNMRPGSPFVKGLAKLPIVPTVEAHSIIAVKNPGSPLLQNDGVVEYKSAHIEGVESEKVVRSSHSCQGHPDTVAEVRRILIEHLEAAP
jgi:triacylglycerol esterase/lipase EstA (alpha/beta hydrolase family)